MNSYDLWDFFNESENEAKRKEYNKAQDKLSQYLTIMKKYIDNAESNFSGFNEVYSYSYKLKGNIADGFYRKTPRYESEIKGYIERANRIKDFIEYSRNKCKELYSSYNKACDEEDRIKRKEWEENH